MIQVLICPMNKLRATSRKLELILVPRNPVLTSFIINKTSMWHIAEPNLQRSTSQHLFINLKTDKKSNQATFNRGKLNVS